MHQRSRQGIAKLMFRPRGQGRLRGQIVTPQKALPNAVNDWVSSVSRVTRAAHQRQQAAGCG